jgi:uncharacterized protein YyaL (SSP411 family)
MKHRRVACMALMLAAGCTVAARGEGLQWLSSAQQAAQVAADSGKPILVYFRSANCHYCDLMQSNVWQDADTAATIMRDFVPLKLTREDNPQAVQVLKVKGFPSTIIFSADRQYVDRLDGYVDVERFLTAVNKMRSQSARR